MLRGLRNLHESRRLFITDIFMLFTKQVDVAVTFWTWEKPGSNLGEN
jgi:hypothetical protein